jgi:hypothetical protein
MKIDYTIKGTKLPIIPKGTEHRVVGWDVDATGDKFGWNKEDFISFGYEYHKGCTYILCEHIEYGGKNYFMIKLSDIEKLTKQEETMTKIITYSDAQRIVDIACGTWTEILFGKWGKDIVLKNDILITDEDYQKMRKACTSEQHKLFDEIFGEDKPKLKIGDWIMYDSLFKAGAYQIKSFRNNKMKQTAVEWQFEQLFNSFEKFNNGEYTFNEYLKRSLEIFEQAKEMEKEQIIDAYEDGNYDNGMGRCEAEQYYNGNI